MNKLIIASFIFVTSWAYAYPLTIEHVYGQTTIAAKPQRAANVSTGDFDELLALGERPVLNRDWFGRHDYAVWPWALEALGDLEPMLLGRGPIDYEMVAQAQPDVIFAVMGRISQDEYNQLSVIAPTIVPTTEMMSNGVPWDARARLIAKVLNKEAQMAKRIDHIKQKIEQVKAAHPELLGAEFALVSNNQGQLFMFPHRGPRAQFLTELGLSYSDQAQAFAKHEYEALSAERLDLIDTDVLVWLTMNDARADADAFPLRKTLAVYQQGREVYTDLTLTAAFSFGTTLSLEYVLDNLVPQLVGAVDGDPNTP